MKHTQVNYSNPDNFIHATHEVVVKYICPNLDKEIEIKKTKFELDREVVWFEQYREPVHKHYPRCIPRIIKGCECGITHMIFVEDWKFTGIKEVFTMTAEEWEKKYGNTKEIKT